MANNGGRHGWEQMADALAGTIGREVMLARTNLALTRRRAARLAGVSPSTQDRVERGDPSVTVATSCRVAGALGLKLWAKAFPVRTPTLRDTGQLRIAEILRRAGPTSRTASSPSWRSETAAPPTRCSWGLWRSSMPRSSDSSPIGRRSFDRLRQSAMTWRPAMIGQCGSSSLSRTPGATARQCVSTKRSSAMRSRQARAKSCEPFAPDYPSAAMGSCGFAPELIEASAIRHRTDDPRCV